MKWIKATVLLMTLALLLTATTSTTYGDGGAESNSLFSEVEGEPPPSAGVETIASRLVQIDFQQLDRVTEPPGVADPATADSPVEPQPPQKLLLNLFEGVVFTGIVRHVEPTSGGYALWGGLEGVELGSMTLVVNGDVVAGTVRTPLAVYTIRTLGEGVYVIRQIDESTLPSLGEMEESIMYMQGSRTQVDLEVGESMQRPDGSRGPVMLAGPRGPVGPAGLAGEAGPAGERGPAGTRGPQGPAGPTGADGTDGAQGPAGPVGAAGSDGNDGAAGAQGPAGPVGPTGPAGPAGPTGAAGATGPAGAAGGGGALAIVALIIAIVGVVAACGAFVAGRRG